MVKTTFFRMRTWALMLGLTILFSLNTFAQRMEQYTWADYKTKFKILTNMTVSKSTGEEFQASNGDIALSIFPRKGENLSQREMDKNLTQWANDEGVSGLSAIVDIDASKLNGYWGVLVEGTKSDWPVCLMLIIDPDYPDTSMYVWVSYKAGLEDTVLQMLYSFTPN